MTDSQSTPDEPLIIDDGGEQPLPASPEANSAETTNQNTDTDIQSTSDVSAETETNGVDKWAKSQGIDLDNPTPEQTVKLAQRLRDTQAKMHEATSKSAELEAGVGEVIEDAQEAGQIAPADARLLKMEQQLAVTQFYVNNPDARQYDDKMAELVRQKPWLLNDLGDLYRLARVESGGATAEKVAEQARKSERDLIAQKQRAGVSKPSASAPQIGGKDEDPIMAGLKRNG